MKPGPLPPLPALLVAVLAGVACGSAVLAQGTPAASTSAAPRSEVPRVPGLSALLRGANAAVSLSGLHDARTGWVTILQPAIGYSFNRRFSADVSVPVYLHRLAAVSVTPATAPEADDTEQTTLVTRAAQPGDTFFAVHMLLLPRRFSYQATVAATAPTGDTTSGLSSGRATFDFTSRFDTTYRRTAPFVALGVGSSTTLVNQLVTQNFSSLGPLAHFRIGLAVPLPLGASFEADGYEQLPLGDQKIYQLLPGRGNSSTVVVAGRRVIEDNGLTSLLDIPLSGHVTATGYYNRSLRLHDDVVSFGLTYVLRSTRPSRRQQDNELLRRIDEELNATAGSGSKTP